LNIHQAKVERLRRRAIARKNHGHLMNLGAESENLGGMRHISPTVGLKELKGINPVPPTGAAQAIAAEERCATPRVEQMAAG
jgi:hypothetical protein